MSTTTLRITPDLEASWSERFTIYQQDIDAIRRASPNPIAADLASQARAALDAAGLTWESMPSRVTFRRFDAFRAEMGQAEGLIHRASAALKSGRDYLAPKE